MTSHVSLLQNTSQISNVKIKISSSSALAYKDMKVCTPWHSDSDNHSALEFEIVDNFLQAQTDWSCCVSNPQPVRVSKGQWNPTTVADSPLKLFLNNNHNKPEPLIQMICLFAANTSLTSILITCICKSSTTTTTFEYPLYITPHKVVQSTASFRWI